MQLMGNLTVKVVMIMGLIDEIEKLGADREDALNRYMGKAEMYERMLKKYIKAVDDACVKDCFDRDDYENALANAHALKGVSGNLSLVPLYQGYSEVVRLIRAGENEKAKDEYMKLIPLQDEILACISKYI